MQENRLPFPSPEWSNEYCKALNESEEYREAARNWREGAVMLVVTDLPESVKQRYGAEAVGMVLDLHEGVCRGVEWVAERSSEKANFIISGSFQTWVDIISGKLHPTTALMTRRLKLEKGSIGVILRFARAAIAMVSAAQKVPTVFPS
jgi:putative sterol carrier protein